MSADALHDPESFRQLGHQIVDLLADHLADALTGSIPARPEAMPSERRAEWRLRPASGGNDLLDVFQRSVQQAHHVLGPRSVGHQVAPPLPQAALADFVASFLNNSAAVFDMGPVATSMEVELIDWMGERLGLPGTRGGALVMGGSIGNLTALLAIRQAMVEGDAWTHGTEGHRFCILSSAQTHYCVRRAVQILGFGHDGLVEVPVDAHFRLDAGRLGEAMDHARALGRTPIAVIGSAGSTSTGAIDPLDQIADFCEDHGLWFHVDGAHGASFVLAPRTRDRLRGIERADSVVWDAHKTMLVPSLCTGVVFRDGSHLDQAFAQKADYLFGADNHPTRTMDLGRRTIECTKPWVGLKLWTVLHSVGEERIGTYLDACNDVVDRFARVVAESADFEPAHDQDLNIFCFRHRPDGMEGEALCRHQDRIRERVVASSGWFLTRTVLEARAAGAKATGGQAVWLRITVLHPETRLEDLEQLLEALRGAATSDRVLSQS